MQAGQARSCEIVGVIDEVRLSGVRSARSALPAGLPAGLNGIKLVACCPQNYATARLLRRPLPNGAAATMGDALDALKPSAKTLKQLREQLPEIKLIVAPYDLDALRTVERAPIDAFQIDATCSTHLELIAAAASVGKPLVLSTWASTRDEVRRALDACGGAEVALVHSVRRAPLHSLLEDIAALRWLVGLGRSLGCATDEATPFPAGLALAMGATFLQVPVGTGVSADGDAASWAGFLEMVRRIERMHGGHEDRSYAPDELDEVEDLRVGLAAAAFIPKGTVLSAENIAVKAPAIGIGADLLAAVLNRVAAYDIEEGEPITFGMLQ